jgi:hypothetical protein
VRYRCRVLFSQVNSDLDDIFLDRAAFPDPRKLPYTPSATAATTT